MSLDVYLTQTTYLECKCGEVHKIKEEDVYNNNITHNLGEMAKEAGIYYHVWRPDEIDIIKASELIKPLEDALCIMKEQPKRFKKHDSPNGWGLYENFVPWLESYLDACKDYPDSIISVSR